MVPCGPVCDWRSWPAADDLVFRGSKGAGLKRGNWRKSVKWADKIAAADLSEDFHFHDLRHTGNQLAARSGASTRELMRRMGHSTVRAALNYQHATDDRGQPIAKAPNALIEAEKLAGVTLIAPRAAGANRMLIARGTAN